MFMKVYRLNFLDNFKTSWVQKVTFWKMVSKPKKIRRLVFSWLSYKIKLYCKFDSLFVSKESARKIIVFINKKLQISTFWIWTDRKLNVVRCYQKSISLAVGMFCYSSLGIFFYQTTGDDVLNWSYT